VAAVDGILQVQAAADADYFLRVCGRALPEASVTRCARRCSRLPLAVHRLGVQDERFQKILGGMITEAQMKRIGAALVPILN
jgi:hypothetical protein